MKTIYITDITLHAKDFRNTTSLAKAEQKKSAGLPSPRIYSTNAKVEGIVEDINPDGTFRFEIALPPDLVEGIERGEIELREFHEGGTPIYAGKDLIEKLEQMKRKERNGKSNAVRVWRKR